EGTAAETAVALARGGEAAQAAALLGLLQADLDAGCTWLRLQAATGIAAAGIAETGNATADGSAGESGDGARQ
ncbi:hypothetical protein, partial [Ferrovibrio sp.]|uniref:hypothetical protein n=1 Tax=Ferrovibrio sp. TaxID=1917215 RepID=UPI00311EAC9B